MRTEGPTYLEKCQTESKPFVLVVDDDETHLRLIALLADRLGIAALTVSSCADAIEIMKLFSFDIILMDYRMPEVDGVVCTRQIRRLDGHVHVPIIAVTAHVTSEIYERCLGAGMDDFLGKPFTVEELNEKLWFWIKKSRLTISP